MHLCNPLQKCVSLRYALVISPFKRTKSHLPFLSDDAGKYYRAEDSVVGSRIFHLFRTIWTFLGLG